MQLWRMFRTRPWLIRPSGNLVGDFNGYFIPGSGVTEEDFVQVVNQNAYDKTTVSKGRLQVPHLRVIGTSVQR